MLKYKLNICIPLDGSVQFSYSKLHSILFIAYYYIVTCIKLFHSTLVYSRSTVVHNYDIWRIAAEHIVLLTRSIRI